MDNNTFIKCHITFLNPLFQMAVFRTILFNIIIIIQNLEDRRVSVYLLQIVQNFTQLSYQPFFTLLSRQGIYYNFWRRRKKKRGKTSTWSFPPHENIKQVDSFFILLKYILIYLLLNYPSLSVLQNPVFFIE